MMIEQPLAHDDIIDHAELQAALEDADLPGRVHPLGASCRAGDSTARLPHHQHQAGPRRRISRKRSASTMSAQARGHSGLVRRHAGKRHRPRAQHRAVDAAEFRAARRRLGQQALLEARHHRAGGRSDDRGTIALTDKPGFGYELDSEFLDEVTVRSETLS